MWMFTSDQDAAFLQAVGRMKQIWKELCLTRLDTAIQDNSVIDGVKSESYRLKHFAVSLNMQLASVSRVSPVRN